MTAPRKETLTAEYLRSVLDYNAETGALVRKVARGNAKPGDLVECAFSIDGVTYLATRVIWCHHYGSWPDGTLFLYNGNPADRRIKNIGIVPPPPNDGAITAEYLRQILHYEPDTGNFFHKITSGQARFGQIAGCPRKQDGSWVMSVDGRTYHRNRLAWFYVTGEWPKNEIDHKNGDRSDDRFVNLREATHAQNAVNRGASKNSKTGIKGVYPTAEGRFQVQCSKRHVGSYRTIGEARVARIKAETEAHGEFAYSQRHMANVEESLRLGVCVARNPAPLMARNPRC